MLEILELRAFAHLKGLVDQPGSDEEQLQKLGVTRRQIDWVMGIKTEVIDRDQRRRKA